MKITEITGQSRKVIKRLAKLYISYVMDRGKYNDLADFMTSIENSTDPDIQKEWTLVRLKLHEELIRILQNE